MARAPPCPPSHPPSPPCPCLLLLLRVLRAKVKIPELIKKLEETQTELSTVSGWAALAARARARVRIRASPPSSPPSLLPLTPAPATHLVPPPSLPSPALPCLQLRVAQVTGGAASKVGKIKQTRKNIARVLTVINQKARRSYAKQVEELPNNQKPKSLRAKKTRAIRRALTKKEVRGKGGGQAARARAAALAQHLRPPYGVQSKQQALHASHTLHTPTHPPLPPLMLLQLGAQTIKQKKKIANYAGIKYAVKA